MTSSTTTSIPIKTLYAYDGSGSTGGSRLYHETSQSIFRTLPADGSTRILFWDSAARVISPDELRDINLSMKGCGGTDPSAVARHIVATNFHGNLVFLSDGQVYSHQVDFCDRTLPAGWTFESVRVILVETGLVGSVNMSVSCPFTRNSPHTVQMVTLGNSSPKTVTQVTPDVIALLADLDAIKTVADWTAAAPLLEPAVIARTMGTTGDPSLRDRLLALKKRIQRAEADAKGGSSTTVALYDALASGNTNAALALAADLTREYYGQEDDADIRSWSGQINRLVSMCEGALRGTFDLSNVNGAIQSDRARRAPMATPAEATAAGASEPDLSVTTDTTTSFVCPITLDATGDSDVALLITDGEPLLAGVDKDIVNSLANCPLYIFRYPELLVRFQARLDHPLSLRALKEAEAVGASITESPMTRNPVLGAICLGPHDDHGAATNWTLARLTAGGKCLGNPDLWFAVIWFLVNRGAVPYLSPILPQLTAHLTWRLHAHKAPLSLLGTPEFPTTRVPLSVAIWYALASSAMTPQPPPARETVRAHLPYVEELLELLKQTGFPLPGPLSSHLKRLRVAMAALAWSKRDEVGLRGSLRALTQRALLVDKTWIFLDGPAPAAQIERVLASLPPIFQELTEPELIGIGRLVGPSKSAADVVLHYDGCAPARLPEAETKWTYGLAPIPRFPIPVCLATCRPYYKVPPTKTRTWEDEARFTFHMEPNQFLPVHAEFGHYVVKYGAFPTASELLLHLWRRVTAQGRTTLPAQVEGFVEDILRDFAEVMATLTPAEVAARFQASVKRVDRERMEATSS